MRGLGDDRHRLRPDAQQRLVGRPDALARGVALGGQQALGDEGLDERCALGPARLEAGAVERADDRRRRAGQRVGGDVAHQPGDQVGQLAARGGFEPRQRFVGGFRHRRVHAVIVGKAQHAVAARRFRRAEARKRHLQERQGVAAARVGDELGGERAARALLEGERRFAQGDGPRRHVLELALRRRQQIEGRAVVAQRRQALDRLEPRIGVAAQPHDDGGEAVARQRRDQRAKALGGPGFGLDQQPFGLIDGEEQARRARRLERLGGLARRRRLVERVAQRGDGGVGVARQLLGEQGRVAKRPLRQLRPERLGGEQALGERGEGVGAGEGSARRHRSISGKAPGRAMRGAIPARSSDDLPDPLAPMTSRNGARRASPGASISRRRRIA